MSKNEAFKNEALTDFTLAGERAKFSAGLADLDAQLRASPLLAQPIVNGIPLHSFESLSVESISAERYERCDPSNGVSTISVTQFATLEQTEQAIQSLHQAAPEWDATPFTKRAAVIAAAAGIMRSRKIFLSGVLVREAGKSWKEADADVAEAIDFCEYYASEMLRLGEPVATQQVSGEDNVYFYQARGVCAVIAPWNFPFAIACGMATAALVAGNVVALKPSEQTSGVAHLLCGILFEAGLPKNTLAFLPGRGELIGRHLVEHPLVDMIVFTGSKPVGLEIIRSAAEMRPGQRNIKKVVAELGGKNAIIVDEDADLDEAIKGILSSAFGFSGQKCSACSRVIAVGDAYEPLMARLADAARDIIMGPASDPATLVGPVIDRESQERILGVIKRSEDSHTVLFKGSLKGQINSSGFFVPPNIFRDVEESSPLWIEEVFGPVVACAKARDFTEALQMANKSEYALTGGVFSRSPANLERARREFKVGNLYLNRSCTGALVQRQPFGGFRMSGIGSKAGGPDYLLQFLEPRTVSENTMRRGFAPGS